MGLIVATIAAGDKDCGANPGAAANGGGFGPFGGFYPSAILSEPIETYDKSKISLTVR